MKIGMFRRRQESRPFPALLQNYLARAQAIADAGGGNLWVIEPSLPIDQLPAFADAVGRHLSENDVVTGGIAVLEGTTSARIAVLAEASPALRAPEVVLPADAVAQSPERSAAGSTARSTAR